MAKNEQNLKLTQEFVRQLLAKNFNQKIEGEKLKEAAERLCDAIPSAPAKAA